jgi:Invasin, domain 3
VVTTFSGSVTVAIGTNPGGGTLAGTTAVALVNGVATFSNLSIDKAGTGYALTAATTGLTGATSSAFNITAGAASQFAFTVQPTATVAGAVITPAVQVSALDAAGNVATGFAGTVAVAIGTNAGGGTLAGTTSVTAVAGVATFSTLSINKPGTGYTLTAADPFQTGLTGATSAAFDIVLGTATQLVFSVQPTNTTAGSVITPAVQVSAKDAAGNVVASFTGAVTVALGANPGGGTLSGTTTVTAVNGVATFSTLSINKSATGYTLTAATTGLTGATSAPFNITLGTATHLAFTVQPTNTAAGAAISPAVQVTALDASGSTATTFTGSMTVALGANPGSGTLAGTTTVTAVNGVATFSTLSINKVGTGYTLTAAATGLTGATSSAFSITPGPASQVVFTVQPTNAVAGAAITPAVQVTALDASGNTATAFSGNVTVAVGVDPGGGTVSGTTTVAAAAGVATFANLSINVSGTGYTLTAAATGLTGATSSAFTITAGTATKLAFTAQPTNTPVGATITPAVQVSAEDAFGNLVSAFTGSVTVAIGTNPSGGALAGTTTVVAVGGVASFSTLSINKSGTGYTLTAAATGLTGATSATFSITGTATQLAFTVQPTTTAVGAIITPAVQVTARDANGNPATTFTGNVTMAIGANPGGGALAGTTTVAAVSGVATFSTLSINKIGTGYTLTASAAGLPKSTSAAFNITAGPVSATTSTVAAAPTSLTAGNGTTTITVTARDANNNLVSGATVVLSATGTGNMLTQPTGPTNANGVTTGSLSSTMAESKTVTAVVGGVTLTQTATVTVTAGNATKLGFTAQPTNTSAGSAITPPVQVSAQDAFGNTVPSFTGNVTVAIGTNPSGGTLSGTKAVAAVSGVATFSNLSIDKAGTGYTLTATTGGLTAATSAGFNIAGAATQLAFTVQPTTTVVGATITPAVQVTALDASGNPATNFAGNVTVAIGANPGGGTLAGTTTVTAVNGVASFSTLSINKVATGYTFTAAATGLTGATSAAFAINTNWHLVFTAQPANTEATKAMAPVQVTAEDPLGNVATAFTGSVTVALGANPGNTVLNGTTTVAAVNGAATFSNLSISTADTGYTLTAAATGLTGATSARFNILPGVGTHLAFTVEPVPRFNPNPDPIVAGQPIGQPYTQVAVEDASGNTVTTYVGSVTTVIGSNPGGGTLSGTITQPFVNGLATFSDLTINKVGVGYTLTSTSTGLRSVTSDNFTITNAPPTQLAFTVQPVNATAGATITPAVQVSAQDQFGNLAPAFAGSVGVEITAGTGTSGAALSGGAAVTPVGGVATFSALSIDKAGAGYTLTAPSAGGLSAATSAAFTIFAASPVSATTSTVAAAPTSITAGSPTATITVTAKDATGKAVSGATVFLSATGSGNTITQPAAVTDVNGLATGTLKSTVAESKTVTAVINGVTVTQTATVTVTAGAATQLVFTVQPVGQGTQAGAIITPPVQVSEEDALGNTVTTFTGTVTVALGVNGSGATLSGTLTVNAVAGVATFSNLSVNNNGTGYTLTATTAGLPVVSSLPFNIP